METFLHLTLHIFITSADLAAMQIFYHGKCLAWNLFKNAIVRLNSVLALRLRCHTLIDNRGNMSAEEFSENSGLRNYFHFSSFST